MAAKSPPPFIPQELFPVFSPTELCMLRRVLDDAFAELQKVNGPFTSAMRAQLTRELLAHRVMTCAELGERDPRLLKQHAVRGMTRSKRRQKDAA